MKKIILLSFTFISICTISAQVGIGTTTPNARAALDITDTTRGLLIPRMTMVQRIAISVPPVGLMVYQVDSTKGFWHFDGVKWNHIYSSANTGNVGGKTKLILSDTITNAQAQAIIDADFGPNTQEVFIVGCSKLTSVNLPLLTTSSNVLVIDNPLLNTLNLQNLRSCTGHINIENCPLLATLNLNSLQNIFLSSITTEYALIIQKTRIGNLTLPLLKQVLGNIVIYDNNALATINFPLLSQHVYQLNISKNPSLTSIGLPLITVCDMFYMDSNTSLTSFTFPSLTQLGFFYINGHTNLISLNFPALTRIVGLLNYNDACVITKTPNLTSCRFDNLIAISSLQFDVRCKLPSSEVNYLLSKFASITPAISGRQILLAQLVSAPPTGQGIIDKATLIANGNLVTTN